VCWLTFIGTRCSFHERFFLGKPWRFTCCRPVQQVTDTLTHFPGGFIGKGKGQDFMGMIYLGKEPQVTARKQPRFS
jgi:hypothetical protein